MLTSGTDHDSLNLSQLGRDTLREHINKAVEAVANIKAPESAVNNNGSSNVSGQIPPKRESTSSRSDFSSNKNNYTGDWTGPADQRQVSSSASVDLMHTDLKNPDSQSSVLDQNYSSHNTQMTKTISEENLSENSKKSNLAKSSSSKASQSSEPQNIKSQSENSQNKDSSDSSVRKRKSNSRSQSSDSKSVAYPENKSSNNNDEPNSEHRSVADVGVRRLSSDKIVRSGARNIDNSQSSSTTLSGDFGAFLDGVSFSESAIATANPPPHFTLSDEKSSLNTNSDVGDFTENIALNITPKKQSSSRKHGSSSSSSKKSSDDPFQSKNTNQPIILDTGSNRSGTSGQCSSEKGENLKLKKSFDPFTWEKLSGLGSFRGLQGVHDLQSCFARAFGYSGRLDGTPAPENVEKVKKAFQKTLSGHSDTLARNGHISKMFEHLRKHEGDTYQAVSDKWDATRALVQGLNPAPDGNILKLLWKLDGTGKHEKDLIAKLNKLNDQGAELISLIPENTTFSTLLKMYSDMKNRTIVVSDDDYVPSASTTDDPTWTSKSSSRSGSNSDDDPKPNSGENKKINHADDVPSRKSSNHGLTQQQLLTDENFKNLPDENLKKAFANAFGFQYGGQSDVPGDKDILDQFRTLFADNWTKYVTSGTYERIIALFELLQRQAGDTYSEIQDKLIAIYNLLRANRFKDSQFIADFWRWNISDPNDDLLVKHFWHSDRGWDVLPKAHMDYMIKNLHDCVLRRRLMEIIPQNLEGVSWNDLLQDDDLNSLPEDMRKLFYGAFHFNPQGYHVDDFNGLVPALRKRLASLPGFCVRHKLWKPISNLCIRLKAYDEERFIEFCDKLSSVEFLSGEFGNNLDKGFISAFWMWDPDYSENNSLVEYYRDDPETGKPLPGKMYIDFLISEHSDLEIVQSLQNMVDSLQPRPAEEEEEEAPDPTSWESLSKNENLQNLPDKLKRILLAAFGFDTQGDARKPDHPTLIQRLRSIFSKNYEEYTADKYHDNLLGIFEMLMNKSAKYYPYAEIWNKVDATNSLQDKFGKLDQDFMVAFWKWKPYEDDTSLDQYYFEDKNGFSASKQYIDSLAFDDKDDDYVDDGVYSLDKYLQKIIDRATKGQGQQPNSEEE